jgi:hypothetical protein
MTSKTTRAVKAAATAETAAFDTLVALNKDAFNSADDMALGAAETVEAFGTETFDFIRRRLDRDFAMPQKLLGCWTPQEAMGVYLDFLETARMDYLEEADRMAKIGQGIAQSTMEMMKLETSPATGKGNGAGTV